MKKLLLLIVFSCLLIIGCGNDDSVGGACGLEVVGDYNEVVLACQWMNSDKDVNSCKSKAQSFLNKYPNINCQVEKPNDHSVDPDTVTITPEEFKEIINK